MHNIQEILQNLGYKLKDCGAYWQTNALYRGGDNPTALQIYKDSGVWKDFVEDTMYLPIDALIEQTIGCKDSVEVKKYLSNARNLINKTHQPKKHLLNEEKSYSITCLQKLLPQYDLYQKINPKISEKTLKIFKSGLATSGKMYRRFVFPIVRSDGRVHGFSGRKAVDFDAPKWIHMGKKNTWFYPYHLDRSIPSSIESSKSVHIVESIGDCLSLYQEGIHNSLVSFGVSLSPKFVSRLSTLGLERIYISFNNDFDSEKNAGFEGAVKSIFKLLESVDFEMIFFVPPHENDFGEMSSEDIKLYKTRCESHDHKSSCEAVISIAQNMHNAYAEKRQGGNKAFAKSLAKFKKLYKFHYD